MPNDHTEHSCAFQSEALLINSKGGISMARLYEMYPQDKLQNRLADQEYWSNISELAFHIAQLTFPAHYYSVP